MAHFALVNENNEVINVVVVDDSQEHRGHEFLFQDLGFQGGTWIKTSYNTKHNIHANGGTPLRKNYAVVGGLYDPDRDAFYFKQPHPSWILNEETCEWEAPVPFPTDESKLWKWDETSLNWIETTSISEALGN